MAEAALWRDWPFVALANLPFGRAGCEETAIGDVAIRVAGPVGPPGRGYEADAARWHNEGRRAFAPPTAEGLIPAGGAADPPGDGGDQPWLPRGTGCRV